MQRSTAAQPSAATVALRAPLSGDVRVRAMILMLLIITAVVMLALFVPRLLNN